MTLAINLDTMQFGNGAGSIKTVEQVAKACKTPMTRITVGSITAKPRLGNIGDTYYFHPHNHWSLNSLGLPNAGSEQYVDVWLPEMVQIAHDAGKKLWASISPFSAEECGQMTEQCFDAGVDGVEINGSCPNVWKDTERKAIPALDPEAAAEMFRMVERYTGSLDEVSFKLSPTIDSTLLKQLATVFCEFGVAQMVCCNAKADQEGTRVGGEPALAFRTDETDRVVKHKGGLGGTGVSFVNKRCAEILHEYMPHARILGIGGIFTGADAERYLEVGCCGFQSTTGYLEYGGKVFVDILMHLANKVEA